MLLYVLLPPQSALSFEPKLVRKPLYVVTSVWLEQCPDLLVEPS